MFKKDLNLSKQLFITLSVSLVLFVAGLAWAVTIWKMDYRLYVEFDKLSDKYTDALGESAGSGNLYARAYHYGNVVNKVDPSNPIDAFFSGGVAWYDNRIADQKFGQAAIDQGMISQLGGGTTDWQPPGGIRLQNFGNTEEKALTLTKHVKQVSPAAVQYFWAGAYTNTKFRKVPSGADSVQSKVQISDWAPNNQTKNDYLGTWKPSSTGYYPLYDTFNPNPP